MQLPWAAAWVLLVAGWPDSSHAERPSASRHSEPSTVLLQLQPTGALSARGHKREARNHFANVDRWQVKFNERSSKLQAKIKNDLTDKALNAIAKSEEYVKKPWDYHVGLGKMKHAVGQLSSKVEEEETQQTSEMGDLFQVAKDDIVVPVVPTRFDEPSPTQRQADSGDIAESMQTLQQENAELKRQLRERRAAENGAEPTLAAAAQNVAREAAELAAKVESEPPMQRQAASEERGTIVPPAGAPAVAPAPDTESVGALERQAAGTVAQAVAAAQASESNTVANQAVDVAEHADSVAAAMRAPAAKAETVAQASPAVVVPAANTETVAPSPSSVVPTANTETAAQASPSVVVPAANTVAQASPAAVMTPKAEEEEEEEEDGEEAAAKPAAAPVEPTAMPELRRSPTVMDLSKAETEAEAAAADAKSKTDALAAAVQPSAPKANSTTSGVADALALEIQKLKEEDTAADAADAKPAETVT